MYTKRERKKDEQIKNLRKLVKAEKHLRQAWHKRFDMLVNDIGVMGCILTENDLFDEYMKRQLDEDEPGVTVIEL